MVSRQVSIAVICRSGPNGADAPLPESSLDHLVCAREQRWCKFMPKRFPRVGVDDELEIELPEDRPACPLQYAIDISESCYRKLRFPIGQSNLILVTLESDPTRCFTRVFEKPASRIQLWHSAPV
jgi:hypothetical protein